MNLDKIDKKIKEAIDCNDPAFAFGMAERCYKTLNGTMNFDTVLMLVQKQMKAMAKKATKKKQKRCYANKQC
jgi:poly(A) polymerase Pap1